MTQNGNLLSPSLRADRLGRYYTSNWISTSLIERIDSTNPRRIVELGTGDGALASAAAKRWKHTRFTTVDADPNAVASDLVLTRSRNTHVHHVHDALDAELAERIGVRLETFDVAICNPPFIRPRWRSSFGTILEGAGLSGTLRRVSDAGADLLFIAQNLRLLRTGGKLGLILPDGLVTAEKFAGVRKQLLAKHKVKEVVQLPRRVFAGTEAQTYLMILEKNGGQSDSVVLREMNLIAALSKPIYVCCGAGLQRLDYSFHAANQREVASGRELFANESTGLGEATISLSRGTVSSHQIDSFGLPVFHLSNFGDTTGARNSPSVPRRFTLSKTSQKVLPSGVVTATTGDILIARVGRNIAHQVCRVDDGPCVISDCVFCLKVTEASRERVFSFLRSAEGQQALEASTHGVAAQYISRADLLNIRITK